MIAALLSWSGKSVMFVYCICIYALLIFTLKLSFPNTVSVLCKHKGSEQLVHSITLPELHNAIGISILVTPRPALRARRGHGRQELFSLAANSL